MVASEEPKYKTTDEFLYDSHKKCMDCPRKKKDLKLLYNSYFLIRVEKEMRGLESRMNELTKIIKETKITREELTKIVDEHNRNFAYYESLITLCYNKKCKEVSRKLEERTMQKKKKFWRWFQRARAKNAKH